MSPTSTDHRLGLGLLLRDLTSARGHRNELAAIVGAVYRAGPAPNPAVGQTVAPEMRDRERLAGHLPDELPVHARVARGEGQRRHGRQTWRRRTRHTGYLHPSAAPPAVGAIVSWTYNVADADPDRGEQPAAALQPAGHPARPRNRSRRRRGVPPAAAGVRPGRGAGRHHHGVHDRPVHRGFGRRLHQRAGAEAGHRLERAVTRSRHDRVHVPTVDRSGHHGPGHAGHGRPERAPASATPRSTARASTRTRRRTSRTTPRSCRIASSPSAESSIPCAGSSAGGGVFRRDRCSITVEADVSGSPSGLRLPRSPIPRATPAGTGRRMTR